MQRTQCLHAAPASSQKGNHVFSGRICHNQTPYRHGLKNAAGMIPWSEHCSENSASTNRYGKLSQDRICPSAVSIATNKSRQLRLLQQHKHQHGGRCLMPTQWVFACNAPCAHKRQSRCGLILWGLRFSHDAMTRREKRP